MIKILYIVKGVDKNLFLFESALILIQLKTLAITTIMTIVDSSKISPFLYVEALYIN